MITPRDYPHLARLPYLTRRSIDEHLALYRRYVEEWNAIQSRWTRVAWDKGQGDLALAPASALALLDVPVNRMNLTPQGRLAGALAQVRGELQARGIDWFPEIVLGDDEFFTYDRATTVNLPWYLANDELWWLVNDRHYRYDRDELVRVLRHEVAHALGYAWELWRRYDWEQAFGDFSLPYGDSYTPAPEDAPDFVKHLHRSGAHQNSHYAQKHPDEDWAETFATWLTPGLDWRAEYREGTGARAKLDFVDRLVNRTGALRDPPVNYARGRLDPTPTYTPRQFLEVDDAAGWSDHAALARREPEVLAALTLHELYFEALGAAQGPPPAPFVAAAAAAFGSWESWAMDLRAIARAAGDGWALATWDRRLGRVRNALVRGHADGIPPDAAVLIALDCHEHAYAGDLGLRRDLYVAGVMAHLDWGVVGARALAAGAWVFDEATADPEPVL